MWYNGFRNLAGDTSSTWPLYVPSLHPGENHGIPTAAAPPPLPGGFRTAGILSFTNHQSRITSHAPIPFVFMRFRTLFRNGAPSTPFPSITCALFPIQRRGCRFSPPVYPELRGVTRHFSHFPYTLPFYVSRKSFICQSYENCRGGGVCFPFWNSAPSIHPYLVTSLLPYLGSPLATAPTRCAAMHLSPRAV